jgi:large subunit ribosomal protein L25
VVIYATTPKLGDGGYMKLQVFKRTAQKKSETSKIRREGHIPAVIYAKGKPIDILAVNGNEFSSLMRQVAPGRFSTTVFTLTDKDGHSRRTIIKEIQYEPTTYDVQHLDFEELFDDTLVNIKVPIELSGAVDCVGVKLGGILRQVIRYLRVRCLPKDIPAAFSLNVKDLGISESRRLTDLEIPPTVRPLADLNEVAVVVAKR